MKRPGLKNININATRSNYVDLFTISDLHYTKYDQKYGCRQDLKKFTQYPNVKKEVIRYENFMVIIPV